MRKDTRGVCSGSCEARAVLGLNIQAMENQMDTNMEHQKTGVI